MGRRIIQLGAGLIKLNVGEYLLSDDFTIFRLEYNLRDEWAKITNDLRSKAVSLKSQSGVTNDAHVLVEEVFTEILQKRVIDDVNFENFILSFLLRFGKWHPTRLDFTLITPHLKALLSVDDDAILKFVREYRAYNKPTRIDSVEPISNKQRITKSSEIFIVHGHDAQAETDVARLIERLGFIPIILHEQVKSGDTIIEKIEKYTNVGFGVVIYTPCDIGALKGKENQLRPRARQNVLLEHGYLMAKLGRKNVFPLVKGDIETPSDISGVVYTTMDSHRGWHNKLADELKAAGYPVDKNKI